MGDSTTKKVAEVLSNDTPIWHVQEWENAMENQVRTDKASKVFSTNFPKYFTLIINIAKRAILLCIYHLNMMVIVLSANVIQKLIYE